MVRWVFLILMVHSTFPMVHSAFLESVVAEQTKSRGHAADELTLGQRILDETFVPRCHPLHQEKFPS